MGVNSIIGRRNRKIYGLAGAIMLLMVLCSVTGRKVRAGSQSQVDRQQPASSEPLVIQGRVTGIQNNLLTVKLPDGYPGARGDHAQFVTAGTIFRVDISHARVLLPDGRQTDKLPLGLGDRVVMLLARPDSTSVEPGDLSPTYSASIVERVVEGQKIITH